MLPEDLTDRIEVIADDVTRDLVSTRRHIHSQPEPSGEERETSLFVQKKLDEIGVVARIAERGTGVVADLDVGQPTPEARRIAIRSDLDALRMPDGKNVEYRSQREGVCHACGHDVHTTVVLGTAVVARRLAESLPGGQGYKLRLIFQPAEETSEGARWMVDDGALDGIDAILGLHVDPERRVGTVGVRYGVMTAFCDEVDIVVEGHGGHAARPHHTRDPIATAAHLVGTLYQVLPRAVDTRNANVFTVGRINGGYAPNVIPERVELQGTLRTTDRESWGYLKERILEVCAGVERATGTRIRCTFTAPLAGVDNDLLVTSVLERAAKDVVGEDHVVHIDKPSLGGEDFAVYQQHVPGAMMRLGCAKPELERPPYLHSPQFDVDERVIPLGTRILLQAALVLGREPDSDFAI